MNNTPKLSATPVDHAPAPPGLGTIFVYDLAQPLAPDQMLSGTRCRQVNTHDSLKMQTAMNKAGRYMYNEAEWRMQNGRTGYVVEIERAIGHEMVSYGWVSSRMERMGDTGCGFQPPHDDVWLYDFATVPDYRGHGYYPLLLRHILHTLAQKGTRYAWIGTAPGNDTSARSIARAGFTKAGHTRYHPSVNGDAPRFEVEPMPDLPARFHELIHTVHVTC
jgi:RimJ/RimL family protein N-acetyltransferase